MMQLQDFDFSGGAQVSEAARGQSSKQGKAAGKRQAT
jgi:hypothetical protein